MGKRGPKPAESQTTSISMRLHVELRSKLEASAKKNDRNLTREIQTRLSESFRGDGPQVQAVLRAISASLALAGNLAFSTRSGALGEKGQWLTDPFAFDQAVKAAMQVLEIMRPPGDPSPPDARTVLKAHSKKPPKTKDVQAMNHVLSRLGELAAKDFMASVRAVDLSQPPPNRIKRRAHLTREIAADLRVFDDGTSEGTKK